MLAFALATTLAAASSDGLHDPRGSVEVGLSGGGSFGENFSYGVIGASVGYAVLTGVVPGVRGAVFFGDLTGGEVAGTATLTPPVRWPVVPFVIGEVGHAWQEFGASSDSGVLLGVGGGVHLGRPGDRIALRGGLIYRYYDLFSGQSYIAPIVSLGIRF